MNIIGNPCPQCPWVISDTCSFGDSDRTRKFIDRALKEQHHRCHTQPYAIATCVGSQLFLEKAIDGVDHQKIWDVRTLIDTADRQQI